MWRMVKRFFGDELKGLIFNEHLYWRYISIRFIEIVTVCVILHLNRHLHNIFFQTDLLDPLYIRQRYVVLPIFSNARRYDREKYSMNFIEIRVYRNIQIYE